MVNVIGSITTSTIGVLTATIAALLEDG